MLSKKVKEQNAQSSHEKLRQYGMFYVHDLDNRLNELGAGDSRPQVALRALLTRVNRV